MSFKEKLNEIFGIGEQPTVVIPPEKPRDVIELTPLDDFRNNVRAKLNGIKNDAVQGVVNGNPISQQTDPSLTHIPSSENQCNGIIVERENDIDLDTLKGSIRNLGPQKVSEIIAKLSTDKKEVDAATGMATSEFDNFVDGLKQEAIEVILGSQAPQSQPSTPEQTPSATSDSTSKDVPKTPEQKLPDLVTSKL
jgi:hypothetical protein